MEAEALQQEGLGASNGFLKGPKRTGLVVISRMAIDLIDQVISRVKTCMDQQDQVGSGIISIMWTRTGQTAISKGGHYVH